MILDASIIVSATRSGTGCSDGSGGLIRLKAQQVFCLKSQCEKTEVQVTLDDATQFWWIEQSFMTFAELCPYLAKIQCIAMQCNAIYNKRNLLVSWSLIGTLWSHQTAPRITWDSWAHSHDQYSQPNVSHVLPKLKNSRDIRSLRG